MGEVEGQSIRWSSAQVEPVGDFYELRVDIASGTVSEVWTDCLNEEATRLYREQRERPWGLVGLWGKTLVVTDLEEGHEESLKAHLAALFIATAAAAAAKRRSSGKTRVQHDRAVRERTATEIAERLQSIAGA